VFPMSYQVSARTKCSECGRPVASVSRQLVCSKNCKRARKSRLQSERRKAARDAHVALRPARSPLVFEWAFHAVHEALRRIRGEESVFSALLLKLHGFSGEESATDADERHPILDLAERLEMSVLLDFLMRQEAMRAVTEIAIPEPEVLPRLLNANPKTVRLLVNQSRWLRGSGEGQGNVLGRFLWEHPDFFVRVKKNQRLRTHRNHSDERIEFLAKTIAAEIAGYAMSAGDGHLAHEIERCRDCKKQASIDRNICLHRNVRLGELGCRDCLVCVHPNAELGDQVCPNCGAEITYLRNALWELYCQIALISLGVINPHSPDECRDSTHSCLAHDPVPSVPRHSRAWCGRC